MVWEGAQLEAKRQIITGDSCLGDNIDPDKVETLAEEKKGWTRIVAERSRAIEKW